MSDRYPAITIRIVADGKIYAKLLFTCTDIIELSVDVNINNYSQLLLTMSNNKQNCFMHDFNQLLHLPLWMKSNIDVNNIKCYFTTLERILDRVTKMAYSYKLNIKVS